MAKKDVHFKYVHYYDSRHGRPYAYFRPPKAPSVRLPTPIGSPEFLIAYAEALQGKRSKRVTAPEKRSKNDFNALTRLYYGSQSFMGLRPSTRTNYKRVLDKFCMEHGHRPVAGFERKHAEVILGAMSDRPQAANNLMKRLRMLLNFAVDVRMITANPIANMKGYQTQGDGFHTWTEAEIEQFVARHPPGTKAYLALMLMLCTGQRKCDARALGWKDVDGGRIAVRQQKTDTPLMIPITQELGNAIANLPAHAPAFLLSEYGRPFSVGGFGNWMRKRCDEAGLPQCSSHGLRKACARRLAEAGCTVHEIKAITGHKSDAEVRRYTEKSDQILLSERALEKLQKRVSTPNSANHSDKVSKHEE